MIGRDILRENEFSIAFLLVVHNKPKQINYFIKQLLQYEKSYIYIHVDAKSMDIIPYILQSERVIILPKHFDVKWGDYSQIQANNYLLEYAISTRHHNFYSLHSGTDLLIRPISEFIAYLSITNLFGYYNCSQLPRHWQYGGGVGRLALYWPKCFRKRLSRNSPLRYFRSLYGRLFGAGIIKGKKLPDKYKYYGGSDWFTVREDCVSEFLEFVKLEKDFNDLFINSLSGSEIYYVTIFELIKGNRMVLNRNSLRFVDWAPRGQILEVGSPNICRMSYVREIEMSGLFFARKFDIDVDPEIVTYFVEKCCVNNS